MLLKALLQEVSVFLCFPLVPITSPGKLKTLKFPFPPSPVLPRFEGSKACSPVSLCFLKHWFKGSYFTYFSFQHDAPFRPEIRPFYVHVRPPGNVKNYAMGFVGQLCTTNMAILVEKMRATLFRTRFRHCSCQEVAQPTAIDGTHVFAPTLACELS